MGCAPFAATVAVGEGGEAQLGRASVDDHVGEHDGDGPGVAGRGEGGVSDGLLEVLFIEFEPVGAREVDGVKEDEGQAGVVGVSASVEEVDAV